MNTRRIAGIYILFLTMMFLVAVRFFIIAKNGSAADTALAGQYSRRIDIVSRKGGIFDRNGVRLDTEIKKYLVFVNPDDFDPQEKYKLAQTLSERSSSPQSDIVEKLFAQKPFTIETKSFLSGQNVLCFPKYNEKKDNSLCHIIGYRNADGKAVSGITLCYDDFLSNYSSSKVYARYESDASGRIMADNAIEIFDDGYSYDEGVFLTIDDRIQNVVAGISQKSLEMGAIVVQNINSGEIVALVSMPSYDISNISAYLDSEKGELLNRCFLPYTPGSVFKSVVTAAALSKGFDAEYEDFECQGSINVGDVVMGCHNRAGHGLLDLNTAFSQSCNPYFINLGTSIGMDEIISFTKKLGIGEYDSLNLLKTSKGVLPDHSKNSLGSTANLSIGQGDILLTPVQVCSMISTMVTGVYHKPSVVKKLVSCESTINYGRDEGERVLQNEICERMRTLFEECVNSGTGHRARSEIVTCAGKTATAQSGQKKGDQEILHSWFAGYFPADSPKYSVCVLCDGNAEKNEHPSAIFKEIAEGITKKGY